MKLSVAFLVHFLAFAYAVPTAVISVSSSTSTSSSSPIAFLPAAKQVVEIDIFRNANFNRSFPLVYFRSIQRVVKRHEIIGLHDENYRLAKRQTYGFGTAVERYAFGPAVERPNPTATSSSSTSGVFYAVATDISYDSEYLSPIAIGSQKQTMNVVYDTGSSDLWVFSTQCGVCSGKSNLFNPSLSSTYVGSSTSFDITYGDGSQASGHTATDNIAIGGVTFKQTIDITTSVSSNLLSSQLDGILGLGFQALEAVQGTKTIMQNMWSDSLLKQDMFGVQLIKDSADTSTSNGGKWTFGGYDTSVIRGSLSTASLVQQVWWQINVPSIRVGTSYSSFTPSTTFIVDTGTTLILLSKSDCDTLYSNLPGGQLNGQYGVYTLWCNATSSTYTGRRNVYFDIGGSYFGVPAADLLWETLDNENCYGAIQSWGSGNGISILGDVFLKNVYAVFDVGNSAVRVAQRTDVTALTD